MDDGDALAISMSSGQGVQAGSGNVQNNTYFQKASIDIDSLRGLNPRTAVDRILKLAHEDATCLFAMASAHDMAEIFATLLTVDDSRAVAILGDLNPRKIAELVASLADSPKWLTSMPEAVDLISQKTVELGWVSANDLKRLNVGFSQQCQTGSVVWSRFYGAHAIEGEIETLFTASDDLGFPTGGQVPASPSPFGTVGVRQSFVAGDVYVSERGAYLVRSGNVYGAEGDCSGWLGFPVEEVKVELAGFGWLQRFEGGAIFAHHIGEKEVSFAVHADVLNCLPNWGQFWPVSKAIPVISPSGSSGRVQRFLVHAAEDGGREAAACSSDQVGTHIVAPEIWNYYHSKGNAESWLGYPVSSWRRTGMTSGVQLFEGGSIFWRSDIGAFAVSSRISVEPVTGDGGRTPGNLGYPTSEEHEIGSSADRIQFFEHGVVTVRNGMCEVWTRSEQGNLEQ
jgi:hypothetical protein